MHKQYTEFEENIMDLGIAGKKAIVCAASKGLGRACALSLAREGVEVVICARTAETLEQTAAEISKATGVSVITVATDITTPEGRSKVLAACPNPDILINNAGGPPPGDFRDWSRDDWIKALDANMLTPIELIKATVDGMIDRQFGRIVNITSGAVKAPIDILGLSNGARAGLTGFIAGLARKTVRHNVTINNLLPGPFDTDRLRGNFDMVAKKTGKPVDEVRQARMAENPAGRFGYPEEFGETCAFLCGQHAGFITGQNLLMDGGAFPGTL
jgi:3-oxoacyl-[acyl-carrier protein] reductase